MTGRPQGKPAFIDAGGVFLPGEVCEQLWRFVQRELDRHRRDGGRVRPELAEAVLVLRQAAQAYLLAQQGMSAAGHDDGHATDLGGLWDQQPATVTTEQAATLLGVTSRHMRRIAEQEGIEPEAPNTWNAGVIRSLASRRRSAA